MEVKLLIMQTQASPKFLQISIMGHHFLWILKSNYVRDLEAGNDMQYMHVMIVMVTSAYIPLLVW